MNAPITYTVRRNVAARDKRGDPCLIAMAMVRFPDGSGTAVAIPEGLLASVPADAVDDFIENEVETALGYHVTRTH